MALKGGQIGFTGYQRPDYSGVVEASGLPLQTIIKGVEDYKQAKEQRKKIDAGISASRTGIESAIKMGEAYGIDVKSALQPVLDKMNDPNTTPYEAAMLGQGAGEQIANVLNIGTKVLAERESQKTAQLKALADMEAARSKPPEVRSFGVTGGQRDMQWNPDTQTWVPIRAGGAKSTPDLLSMVKQFEGFNPNAYGDYRQISVGYGTKGKFGETVTEQEASSRLKSELSGHAQRIMEAASQKGIQLNNNQLNALTSFDFNTGKGPDLINRFGDKPQELAAKITEYTKAGGKELPGLVRRRQIESALYLMPEEQPSAQGDQIGFKPDKPEEKTIVMTADEAKAAGYKVSEPGSYEVKIKGGQLVDINRIGSTSAVESPEQKLSGQRLLALDKKQSELRDFGDAISMDIAQLERINQLLDTSVKTGFGRETLANAKRILGRDVSNIEQFQSLVGNEAMKNIALTKGAISDREMDYFKNVLSPNMGKTTEGNKKIIDFKIRLAKRSQNISRKIAEMQNAGASPFDIQKAVDTIIDTSPLDGNSISSNGKDQSRPSDAGTQANWLQQNFPK